MNSFVGCKEGPHQPCVPGRTEWFVSTAKTQEQSLACGQYLDIRGDEEGGVGLFLDSIFLLRHVSSV